MARGGPRKAGGPTKKGSKAAVTNLYAVEPDEVVIPPMPDPRHWINLPPAEEMSERQSEVLRFMGVIQDDSDEINWPEAVKEFWTDFWTSPMSSMVTSADKVLLSQACVHLYNSINPYQPISERRKDSQAFSVLTEKFGISPKARESLRWQVLQTNEAERRQMRKAADASSKAENAMGGGSADVDSIYSQFGYS